MRNLKRKCLHFTVVALLCSASTVFAGQTVTMDLTSAGNNVLGGVYVGPYYATIYDGTSTVSTQVICDDWMHDSVVPETWTANVTSLDPLGSGVRWGGTTVGSATLTAQQEYDAVAWLVTQMLNPTACKNSSGDCVGDISYAIWELTDPTDPKGTAFANLTAYGLTTDLANAQNWLNLAVQNDSGNFSGFQIFTPQSGGNPQEFITVPESSAPVLLGADLLGLAALIFLFRRRMVRTQS